MKYPQLVSTRAVNAITDWLVSRLDQLGVEAPQLYARFLLSLLQSAVEINDPNEFSNLEAYFAVNRKGAGGGAHGSGSHSHGHSHKRFKDCDIDTLKKLNAVQCLREIVSIEEEISNIEQLVDELFEKLKVVEKQLQAIEDENPLLLATVTIATGPEISGEAQGQRGGEADAKSSLAKDCTSQDRDSNHHSSQAQGQQNHKNSTLETDPKKSYFRAFPALSKEMEDSFRIWRQNAKSLTWPIVERSNNISATSSSSSTSSTSSTGSSSCTLSNSFAGAKASGGHSEKKRDSKSSAVVVEKFHLGDPITTTTHCGAAAVTGAAASSLKRKPKRRRPQGAGIANNSKGSAVGQHKLANSQRKSFDDNCSIIGVAPAGGSGSRRHHRNSSPSYWDTNFEGCWEMGRDLIKEFIQKQNQRNRSTSESGATKCEMNASPFQSSVMEKGSDDAKTDKEVEVAVRGLTKEIEKENFKTKDFFSPVMMPPNFNISLCCDDEEDDDCDDYFVSKYATHCGLSNWGEDDYPHRRLYMRERKEDATSNKDFAQFKAKFTSSVEALWKEDGDATQAADSAKSSELNVWANFSNFQAKTLPPSIAPAVAAFKDDLKNFWNNYYSHHYDLSKLPEDGKLDEGGSVSLTYGCGAKMATNTNDYYSMPSHLEGFDRSVGGLPVRRNSSDECNTPVGVFLQKSIWSDKGEAGSKMSNDSWYTAKRVNELTSAENNNQSKDPKIMNNWFTFSPYQVSKWSEGINAGPQMSTYQQQQKSIASSQVGKILQTDTSSTNTASLAMKNNMQGLHLNISGSNNNSNANSSVYDSADSSAPASMSSTTNTSCSSSFTTTSSNATYNSNWQTPVCAAGLTLPADEKSWSASNPVSLTEMYSNNNYASGIDVVDCARRVGGATSVTGNIRTCTPVGLGYSKKNCEADIKSREDEGEESEEELSSLITLANHCKKSSSFVEYSRIKPLLKLMDLPPPAFTSAGGDAPDLNDTKTENLLTSDRTHFSPIKNYSDGFTFNITGEWDEIKYERSSSGCHLYWDNETYVAYVRNDSLVEEESVTSTPASHAKSFIGGGSDGNEHDDEEFVLKFRLRGCEISCQTDDNIELWTSSDYSNGFNVLYANVGRDINMDDGGANFMSAEAMKTLSQAIAAAAQAVNSQWMPSTTAMLTYDNNYQRSALAAFWSTNEEVYSNEMNYSVGQGGQPLSSEDQQWSMREIGKRCQQMGHGQNNQLMTTNNNNNISGGAGDGHSLWSMCAACACNSEFKSIPANHLLRDELKLEADEIMNDLKYMQDLYIGQPPDAEEEEYVGKYDDEHGTELEDDKRCVGAGWHKPPQQIRQQQQNDEVLKQVNRLIADLLNPAKEQLSQQQPVVVLEKQQPFTGSLWANGKGESNIWQQTEEPNRMGQGQSGFKPLNPIDLLRKLNVVEPEAMDDVLTTVKAATGGGGIGGAGDGNALKLTWEHDNLAELWKVPEQEQQQAQAPSIQYEIITPPMSLEMQELDEDDIHFSSNVVNKNFKNLQATFGALPKDASENKDDKEKQQQGEGEEKVSSTTITANSRISLADPIVPNKAAVAPMGSSMKASANVAAFKRVQQLFHNATAAATVLNSMQRNRKRRHSASQNMFHYMASSLSNNNNVDFADLNKFTLELSSSGSNNNKNSSWANYDDDVDMRAMPTSVIRQTQHQHQHQGTIKDNHNKDGDLAICEDGNQTIITCKYWTAVDPRDFLDGGAQGLPLAEVLASEEATNAFACLIDKNASILRHVTMVTRPLTR